MKEFLKYEGLSLLYFSPFVIFLVFIYLIRGHTDLTNPFLKWPAVIIMTAILLYSRHKFSEKHPFEGLSVESKKYHYIESILLVAIAGVLLPFTNFTTGMIVVVIIVMFYVLYKAIKGLKTLGTGVVQ